MDQYAVLVLEQIIRNFETRIELMRHRGFPYMAKGALISHMEGAPRALMDLHKILKWARRRFYISEREFALIQTMIQRLRGEDHPRIVKEAPPLPGGAPPGPLPLDESTVPRKIAGHVAPWQEWPTREISQKKGR